VLNGFFLTRLPNPLNVISVGSVALVSAVAFRVAQGKPMRAPMLGLAMLFMSFLSYNPPMLTVAFAWTGLGLPLLVLLVWGRSALWRVLRYAVTAAPWALAINLFWLVPFAQAFTGGGGASATAQTDPTAWAWSQAQNSVPNVLTLSANWAWYKPQYLPFTGSLDQPWWIWLRYLLPVLLFVAPLLALPHRRRKTLTLLTAVVIFTVLAKGLQPPFTGLNMWLYGNVPGFWLFREPMSKLGQLLVLFDGLLIAIAVEGLAVRTARFRPHIRTGLRMPVGFAVCAVLAWPYPLVSGAVIPDERPLQPPAHVEVPSFWRSTASFIDRDTADGKVLVLPLDDYYQMPTTWGFSGVDSIAGLLLQHPVLQRHPDGYFGDTPGLAAQIDAVERALRSGDLAAVEPLLRTMGIRWIVLRHDLVVGNPLRTFADPATLRAPLDAVPSLELIQEGTLDVYRFDGETDTVRVASAPLEVPGEPDAMADAVASLPAGQSITGAEDDYTITTADTAENGEARSAADGVWWPVPAVADGEATTTFESTGGSFTVNQRSRADVAMIASEVETATGEPALQLADPTSVLIDGEVVSTRPATTHPIDGDRVDVVRAGLRTLSLDQWLAPAMATDSNAADGLATVPVGANTELTAWGVSDDQPTLSAATPVYDCNNYEPRPQSELQLQASEFTEAGETVTRLSAADHAACVARTVEGVAEGDTVRLRIEYRTEEGKRPQVCLLEVFADGSDQCVFDARMRNIGDWTRYELVHTVAADVVEVRVVLYANVGLRLSPRTVSDYRGLQVEQLDEVLHTRVWPAEAEVRTVQLTPGTHTMSIRGGSYGSQLTPFEALQDCFRYDDATVDEAQLSATVTDDEGEQAVDGVTDFAPGDTIELRAKDHMACIASTMPDYGGAGLYRLEYGYRSVALRKPRVAVYHRGPNVSEPLPANGSETEWSTYRADLQPTLDDVETRLYLYAPRDLAGQQQAVVQYRQVSITPMASSSSVTLLRVQPPTTEPATVAVWKRTTPGSFTATLLPGSAGSSGDPFAVAVAETFAPGWVLAPLPAGTTVTKVRLNGWQNGWLIETTSTAAVDVKASYAPAFLARTAMKLSALSFLALPLWLAAAPFVHRHRDRRRARRRERRATRRAHRLELRLARKHA
jgi:arabinofuranan 3-O-arabinosyltransferase